MFRIARCNMESNRQNKAESPPLEAIQIFYWTAGLTFILLVISVFFMGGGHGTYFFGKLFFPIAMIIAGKNGQITETAVWLAISQIPVYGLIIYFFRKSGWKLAGGLLFVIHFFLVITALKQVSGFD